MPDVMHLSISDPYVADFVRSKAESEHTTPEGYVGGLVREQALAEDMLCPLTLVTAPEIVGQPGQLVRDDADTDEAFAARSESHAKLLGLLA